MSSGKKLTYEEVKRFFESQGCELLEKEYKNARTKMKYKCECGNVSEIVWFSFKNGNRCQKCRSENNSKRFSFTQEQAEEKFRECGCELLDAYTKSSVKVKYKCECGNVSKSTPNNIWKGRRCKNCGIRKRAGENHYMWIEDREQFDLDYAFRQRCYKLITMVLKVTGRVKNERSAKLLGYDYKELQEHVTSHPNWEKVKDEKWHVDHIFPIKAFIDYGISDLKIVNALDNLQPLEAIENLNKNAKYDEDAFLKYLKSKGIDKCTTQ